MRKLFFLFSIISMAFTSCSSDNDPISQNTEQDTVKYKVTLNVKSAGFEIDKTPLKSSIIDKSQSSFLQVIVYNESGTVYSDTIVDQTNLGLEESMSSISLELPKGNYYLSVFNRIYNNFQSKLEDVVIIPNNYETDYYDRGVTSIGSTYTNINIYYYTEKLNIEGETNTAKNIILEPMWSSITNIDTKYSETFAYPEGVKGAIIQISPRYYGFGIKSKLARTLYEGLYKEFSHYDLQFWDAVNMLPIIIAKAENPNLYLDICYYGDIDGYSGGRIVKIQKIKLPVEVENGMNYTISGTIPAVDSIDSNIMNIGLEPFKDLDISFQ